MLCCPLAVKEERCFCAAGVGAGRSSMGENSNLFIVCYLDLCGLTWKQRLHTFVTMLCVLCVVCVCVTLSASSEDLDLI